MVKVKVTKRFNDRETGKRRNVDDICEYTDERAKELIESGYAKKDSGSSAKDTGNTKKEG